MRHPPPIAPFIAALAAVLVTHAPDAAAAAVTNIRIASHGDHVRVVVDLDAPVAYTIAEDGSLELKGLEGENAVLNAAPSQAPLKRVLLTPGTGGARLTFDTMGATTSKAFALTPDKDGGNRVVVDLFPNGGSTAKGSQTAGAALAQATAALAAEQGETHAPPTEQVSAAASQPTAPPASGTTAAVAAPAQSVGSVQMPTTFPPDISASAVVPGMPPEPALDMPSEQHPLAPASALKTASAETGSAMGAFPPRPPLTPPAAGSPGAGYSDETLRAERALDRGDIKDASERAESALKTNPSDLRALVVLGGCRLAQHDAIGAKGAYLIALEADPNFDRARIGLATADDMAGDHAAALAELARVMGHNVPPDDLKRLVGAFNSRPGIPSAN